MNGPCSVVAFDDSLAMNGLVGNERSLQPCPLDDIVLGVQGASAASLGLGSQLALIVHGTALVEPTFTRSGSDMSCDTVNNLGFLDDLPQQPQSQLGTSNQGRTGCGVSKVGIGEYDLLLPPMGPLLTDLSCDLDLSAMVSNTSAVQHYPLAPQPGKTADLVAAAQSEPIIPYSEPPCVPDPSAPSAAGQPGLRPLSDSGVCGSCTKLLAQGTELATSILAGSAGRVTLNEQIGDYVLRAVYSCEVVRAASSSSSTSGKGLARPCLFADREQLASPSNCRCWGLALSKARAAESGAKRARNGTLKPWNVNWNTNSPQHLSQQDELLSIMGSGSSSGCSSGSVNQLVRGNSSGSNGSSSDILLSGGDSIGSSSDTSTARSASKQQQAPGVYVVRSADNKAHVIAYAVAYYHNDGLVPPVMLAGAAPADVTNDLWGNKMKCSKKGHALHQKDLSLFKYAFVVVCP